MQTGQILPPLPNMDKPDCALLMIWFLDEVIQSITPQTARVMSPSRMAQEYAERVAYGVKYGLIYTGVDD